MNEILPSIAELKAEGLDQIIRIYSDGSSRGNPGRGGYGAVVVYPDSHGRMRVDEYGGREEMTTNNRMEIQGVVVALTSLIDYYDKLSTRPIYIYTDSGYLVKGIETWISGWKRNNWMTQAKEPVKNVDLWQALSVAVDRLKNDGFKIKWIQVPGHAGVPGNERCDQIATAYADAIGGKSKEVLDGSELELFKGSADGYGHPDVLKSISIAEISEFKKQKDSGSSSKSSSKGVAAYSYVSMVDGKISTDATWKECEARVRGKSGARFKKSVSKTDEDKIKQEFLLR